MTSLQSYLASHRNEMTEQWIRRIQATLVSPALPAAELRDYVPAFLDEIISALRGEEGLSSGSPLPESSPSAAEHGMQRLRLGFDLNSVVREYGALRDCIVQGAVAAGVIPTLSELQVLSECLVTGIAEAVSEYARQRDAELQRQATEHLAFLAHELRNPLFSAMLAFRSLRRKGLISEGRPASAVEHGLNQMQELLDRTLKVARVGSGVELRLEAVGLRTFLDQIRQDTLSAAEFRDISITVQVEHDSELQADPRLFRSALENLVYNAIKFTRPHGQIYVRGKVKGSFTIVEVEDECGGLPEEATEKLFEAFVRLDTESRGFGLGLAIARQAAEAHGGTLRVQDLPGKGCMFVLELPSAGRAAAPGPGEGSSSGAKEVSG